MAKGYKKPRSGRVKKPSLAGKRLPKRSLTRG